MRSLLVAGLLLSTASCVAPQPPQAPAVPTAMAGPTALVPPPSPQAPAAPAPAAAAPTAPPQPVAWVAPYTPPPFFAAVGPVYLPNPGVILSPLLSPLLPAPPPGRLTLSNFTFDTAHVKIIVTSGPLCAVGPGAAAGEFALPLNGTRVIATPPGADVCWRRETLPTQGQATSPVPLWTGWSRAYTSSGRTVDARL